MARDTLERGAAIILMYEDMKLLTLYTHPQGLFSVDRVTQVLLMVLMGIVVVTIVNLLVLPVTARSNLSAALEKNTDQLGEMLICITRAFLSGRESDMSDEYYQELYGQHQTSLKSLNKNLGEAKREYLVLGREKQYDIEERL